MRFDDLPENWTSLPLDDAHLAAGVIDLLVGSRDRHCDSLLILPCDDYDVGLPAPVIISDTDWNASYAQRRETLEFLGQLPGPGVVMAVSSRRMLPDRVVRGWLRAIEDQLDSVGMSLLAFGVVDLDSVRVVGGRAAHNGSGTAPAA